MANMIGTFKMRSEVVTVFDDGTYNYGDFASRGHAPARFRFSPSGKLSIAFYHLKDKRQYAKTKINPEGCSLHDKEFYLELKAIWDKHLVESILLGGNE